MIDDMLWRTAGKSARYAGKLVVSEPLDVVVVSSPHQSPFCMLCPPVSVFILLTASIALYERGLLLFYLKVN